MKKKKINSKGFTLVEIIFSFLLTLVVLLVINHLIEIFVKSSKKAQAQLDISEVHEQILNRLASPSVCSELINGKGFSNLESTTCTTTAPCVVYNIPTFNDVLPSADHWGIPDQISERWKITQRNIYWDGSHYQIIRSEDKILPPHKRVYWFHIRVELTDLWSQTTPKETKTWIFPFVPIAIELNAFQPFGNGYECIEPAKNIASSDLKICIYRFSGSIARTCPKSFQTLLSCTGARHPLGADTGDEDTLQYLGTRPGGIGSAAHNAVVAKICATSGNPSPTTWLLCLTPDSELSNGNCP